MTGTPMNYYWHRVAAEGQKMKDKQQPLPPAEAPVMPPMPVTCEAPLNFFPECECGCEF